MILCDFRSIRTEVAVGLLRKSNLVRNLNSRAKDFSTSNFLAIKNLTSTSDDGNVSSL